MIPQVLNAVLAAVGVALFLAPNHGKKPSGERPSLAKSLSGLLREPPSRFKPGMLGLAAAWVLGCLGVLLPAMVLAAARQMEPDGARVVLVIGGIAMAAAAPASMFVMAFSVASFGFGGGRLSKPNVLAWVIPVYVGMCGAGAVVWGAGGWVV